jgi:hypothetical protein
MMKRLMISKCLGRSHFRWVRTLLWWIRLLNRITSTGKTGLFSHLSTQSSCVSSPRRGTRTI